MKPNLILLHGAIGSSQQLQPLSEKLQNDFSVHTINFAGHGGDMSNDAFSIENFACQTALFIQDKNLAPVSVFGYSMGGYVATYLAAHQPNLIAGVCTLATKFIWNEEIAAREMKMLDSAKIEEKLPAFAATLQQRHAPADWKIVLKKTAAMLQEMGKQNPLTIDRYATIQQPILLLLGDRDKIVSLEETVQVYKALPDAQLCVLPGTHHPIEQVDTEQLQFQIKRFFENILPLISA